jgi:hypothetical protein
MLSYNPFQKMWPTGWIVNYEMNRKSRSNSKARPYSIPLALIGIAWLIVAAFYSTTAIYLVLTGGWIFYSIPLIVLFTGLFFSVCWQPLYFSDCSTCKNITFAQLIAIMCSIFLFVWLLGDHLMYGLFVLPFMVWNILWTVKVFLEYSEADCGAINKALNICPT